MSDSESLIRRLEKLREFATYDNMGMDDAYDTAIDDAIAIVKDFMEGASAQSADATLDGSEVQRSAGCTMEHTPSANPPNAGSDMGEGPVGKATSTGTRITHRLLKEDYLMGELQPKRAEVPITGRYFFDAGILAAYELLRPHLGTPNRESIDHPTMNALLKVIGDACVERKGIMTWEEGLRAIRERHNITAKIEVFSSPQSE